MNKIDPVSQFIFSILASILFFVIAICAGIWELVYNIFERKNDGK